MALTALSRPQAIGAATIKVFAVVAVALCLGFSTQIQAQSSPKADVVRPASKKSSAAKADASQVVPAESGPCQIGVIPIAGDLFMVETFGPFAFLDRYARTSVAGWALDDLVVSRVRAAATGLSVRRIPFTKEELKSGGRRKQHPLFYSSAVAVRDFVLYLAPRIRCDRYVVVHRHGGTQREYGIGISRYPYNGPVHLFAMMYVRVYDGQNFELIKEAPALMTEDTYIERVLHNSLGGPSRQLDRAMFPEKPTDAAANPVLRDGVRSMLTASLDKTLPLLLRRPAQIPPR